MEQDQRKKRALILLLFGLLCTAGASYVALSGKHFDGSFFSSGKDKDKDDKSLAAAAAAGAGKQSGGVSLASAPEAQFMGQETPLQQEVALVSVRHHTADVGGSSGSFTGKSEDDLFKLGDPAAGIPSGKFVVAQNDAPATPAEQAAGGGGAGQSFAHPDVNSTAPAPTGNAGAPGDGLLRTAGTGSDAPAAVPEASSFTMMGVGALLLAVVAGRRRRSA